MKRASRLLLLAVLVVVLVAGTGFVVRQTVCQYKQTTHIKAEHLGRYGLKRPRDLPGRAWLKLSGGGVLIFNEFGKLRFHIHQRIFGRTQQERLEAMAIESGGEVFRRMEIVPPFAAIHRRRGTESKLERERW